MNKFDRYVYFYICDSIFIKYKKNKSHFSTFEGMCGYISKTLDSSEIESIGIKNIRDIIGELGIELELIFGMNHLEVADYVANFFVNNIWEKYGRAVAINHAYFPNSTY